MKIILHIETGAEVVNIENIIYCETVGKLTKVVTETNLERQKVFFSVFTLLKIEKLLPKQMFFRTHRGVLVNFAHFTGFNTPDDKVILTGGDEMAIARQRKPEFKAKFEEYLLKLKSEKMTF